MNKLPRILITAGEPAGIGPDITIRVAQLPWPAELITVADPDLLLSRAHLLNLPLQLKMVDFNQPATPHIPGTLSILPIKLAIPTTLGTVATDNAAYVVETLATAATLCLNHQADAIVTAPVHKGIINAANIPFSGHTEFFAQACQVPQTVMLFVLAHPALKVALATTHLPLAAVSRAITKDSLTQVIQTLHTGLNTWFKIASPRLAVCGLNPHAGENGYLGREEIEIMAPVIEDFRKQSYNIIGPLPADTLFTPTILQKTDAILAMYHDQALPLVKYLGFGQAVNVTLGLPFIRTSVDHGTALTIAGTHAVDASSMEAALKLAISLSSR